MLMLAIAQEGCMNTGRESAFMGDYVKRIPACRVGELNVHEYCSWLFDPTVYQLYTIIFIPPLGRSNGKHGHHLCPSLLLLFFFCFLLLLVSVSVSLFFFLSVCRSIAVNVSLLLSQYLWLFVCLPLPSSVCLSLPLAASRLSVSTSSCFTSVCLYL